MSRLLIAVVLVLCICRSFSSIAKHHSRSSNQHTINFGRFPPSPNWKPPRTLDVSNVNNAKSIKSKQTQPSVQYLQDLWRLRELLLRAIAHSNDDSPKGDDDQYPDGQLFTDYLSDHRETLEQLLLRTASGSDGDSVESGGEQYLGDLLRIRKILEKLLLRTASDSDDDDSVSFEDPGGQLDRDDILRQKETLKELLLRTASSSNYESPKGEIQEQIELRKSSGSDGDSPESDPCVTCPGIGRYCNEGPYYELLPLPVCPEELGLNMKVYTRNNKKKGKSITRDSIPSKFKGYRMTMYIVHGLDDIEAGDWIKDLKNVILEKVDYNVILVRWTKGAINTKNDQAASNTRTIGAAIALINNRTISRTSGSSSKARQYCVGHGMGAHVCGQAGRTGQFGRITGLDPSLISMSTELGLKRSDADFVDVIHTSGMAGSMQPHGHVDFYPNGGSEQPECGSSTHCKHFRAVQYFTESIRNSCPLSRGICPSNDWLPFSCTRRDILLQNYDVHSKTHSYSKSNFESSYCEN